MKVGEAYVELTAKNAKFNRSLKDAQIKTESFTSRAGAKLRKFGKAAFLPAIAAATALAAALGKCASMAAKEEIQTAQLSHQLKRLGLNAVTAMAQVDALADTQQSLTRFGDTDTRAMLAQMIMLTNDYKGSMQNLSLAQDMAESGMFDQKSAARYLGMAMQGNIEMLGRYIPELKTSVNAALATMTAHEKAAYAVKLLREKFGNLAKEMGSTTAGAWAKIKNAMSDAMEAIGSGFIDELSGEMHDFTASIKEATPALIAFGKTVGNVIVFAAKAFDDLRRGIESVNKLLGGKTSEELAHQKLIEDTQSYIQLLDKAAEIKTKMRKTGVFAEEYLETLKETRTLMDAAEAGTVSYSKAWERMLEIEKAIGSEKEKQIEKIETARSAVISLGATLKELPELLKNNFDAVVENAGKTVDKLYDKLSKGRKFLKQKIESPYLDVPEVKGLYAQERYQAKSAALATPAAATSIATPSWSGIEEPWKRAMSFGGTREQKEEESWKTAKDAAETQKKILSRLDSFVEFVESGAT